MKRVRWSSPVAVVAVGIRVLPVGSSTAGKMVEVLTLSRPGVLVVPVVPVVPVVGLAVGFG